MFGDWVCYNRSKGYVTQVQEVRRTKDGEGWYINCERDKRDPLSEKWTFDSFNVEILSEVPVTTEILVANGFERSGSNYVVADDYYDIVVHELSDSVWEVQYTDCEMSLGSQQAHVCHVHTLQHALRLFGVNKEIRV